MIISQYNTTNIRTAKHEIQYEKAYIINYKFKSIQY